MTRFTNYSLAALAIGTLVSSGVTPASAKGPMTIRATICGKIYEATSATRGSGRPTHAAPTPLATSSVVKTVQTTPAYRISRTEVIAGTQVTLYANFLEEKPGEVHLVFAGTTTNCSVLEWRDKSVTVQLPMVGLNGPKDAWLRIVRPDGRVAKTFPVVVVGQPEIVTHENTIGQPSPATPVADSAEYAGGQPGGA